MPSASIAAEFRNHRAPGGAEPGRPVGTRRRAGTGRDHRRPTRGSRPPEPTTGRSETLGPRRASASPSMPRAAAGPTGTEARAAAVAAGGDAGRAGRGSGSADPVDDLRPPRVGARGRPDDGRAVDADVGPAPVELDVAQEQLTNGGVGPRRRRCPRSKRWPQRTWTGRSGRRGRRPPRPSRRPAAAAFRLERVEDGGRRNQAGARVGDRVGAEAGPSSSHATRPPATAASSPNATRSRRPPSVVASDRDPQPRAARHLFHGDETELLQRPGPGRSSTTSAPATSDRRRRRPSVVPRSRTTLRLPSFTARRRRPGRGGRRRDDGSTPP